MPINLHYVDEIVQVRTALHGGNRGAPPLIDGQHRAGASLNRSCIVMLSALLQAFVEDVFKSEARHEFTKLNTDARFEAYWKQLKSWGNPSDDNIKALFLKIGIPDVFDGLSWQRTSTADIRNKLKILNQVRNGIAHGNVQLRVDNHPYSLTLVKIKSLRDFVEQFGLRFEPHVRLLR